MTETYLAENFLIANTYCVLSVAGTEGAPHAAMMHFAVAEDPLDVYFVTGQGTRKAQSLKDGRVKAALVVGSGESWKTLQMEGELWALESDDEKNTARNALYAKYPADKYHERPDVLFMKFSPKWYRYSDFTTEPPLVLPWQRG